VTRGERTRAGAIGVAVVALLAACDPWRCEFTSHGACVEFETPP
jgi:hypothetical protein